MCAEDLDARFLNDLRGELLTFLRWKQCPDPDELAQETIKNLLEQRKLREIRDPRNYALGIAGNLLARYWAERHRDISPPVPPHSSEENVSEKRTKCLETCLRKLPRQDRKLLEAYFSFAPGQAKNLGRKKMAAGLGISIEALRARVSRILNEIRPCVTGCMDSE
jgi:DNA-directed RNA polymerase specialized sigma24 family protein